MRSVATTAPYGSWKSPVSEDLLAEDRVVPSCPLVVGPAVLWVELRPAEGGRYVLVQQVGDGPPTDLTTSGFSVRSLVYEYGGLAYAGSSRHIFFVNGDDQRIYRMDREDGSVRPITPAVADRRVRFGDLTLSPDESRVVCIRERHTDEGVRHDIVAVPTSGAADPVPLCGGHDFVTGPRFSPDGSRLTWLTWDHPNMPWDGTELWEGTLGPSGDLVGTRLVAGSRTESVVHPGYAPDGTLYYVSDRSGFWNVYRDDGVRGYRIGGLDAEFAEPSWYFGERPYGFLADGTLVAVWTRDNSGQLGLSEPDGERFVPIDTGFTSFTDLCVAGSRAVAVCGSADQVSAVVELDLTGGRQHRVLRSSRRTLVGPEYLSTPRYLEYESTDGATARMLYYPPRNGDFTAPPGELPPLIVLCHGGPTFSASPALNYAVQFWTSRGFALADVDYRGSSGHGRRYREALRGRWGVVDVADCEHAARRLVKSGLADPDRLIVKGASSGGFTALCAATFGDLFAVGVSYYGVADATSIAAGTHKFESSYLEFLIGSLPRDVDRFRERSPLFNLDRLRVPLLLFQGAEDRVVPPDQTARLAEALRHRGVPYQYVEFPGEQHGFRLAETIRTVARTELAFYGAVLGFAPAGSPGSGAMEEAP
ncbi:prolyl oligopeptidase family serine peptidase [Micromonospora sp. NBC_01405]|uniref:S9 family peptidase n=1 Tax=Micromonospora sp. NBC_01405 TaxID=2903589 RepID=UPI0032502DC9